MLSAKVGNIIYGRLSDLCDGHISIETISSLSDEEIKSIGTANSKVKFIRSITEVVLKDPSFFDNLKDLPDEEVYRRLTSIKGIGPWTAKMYLLFVLNRNDILTYEDVAFLQGFSWAYNTKDLSPAAVKKRCKKWKPYSSIAARYMYRALDTGLTKQEFHLYK